MKMEGLLEVDYFGDSLHVGTNLEQMPSPAPAPDFEMAPQQLSELVVAEQ